MNSRENSAPRNPPQPPAPGIGRGGFLAWFAAHPTAANLLMLLFLAMGLMSLPQQRRETFPDFSTQSVQITVRYPGATAEEVEEAVCQRIEDALENVVDVNEIRGEARENIATVVVEMRDKGDFTRFLSEVKTEVEAIDDFPEEVDAPVIKELNKTDMVVSVAVTGGMSASDLKLFCEQLKARMLMEPEISQVLVKGFSDRQIRIEVPAFALQQYGISIQDVARAVAAQSVSLPAGILETRERDILVRFDEKRIDVQGFEDLVVLSGETGAELRLGDFAEITDRFELDEERILFNGKRAGILQVNKTKDEDALRVMDAVRDFLDRERGLSPPGVDFILTQNVSDIVKDRLHMLTVNGIQGLILVFLAMWLFFSFRFSFWVVMGLPVSFLGSLFVMQQIGFSLNMLTMVGLLLAIGLIMDDAIVIAENIAAHLAKGKTALESAIDGTAQVLPGVVSSFLTTMAVFGSIALLIEGDIGKVMWVMPVVLLLTLAVSLVEAFCILPHHLAHSLGGRENAPQSTFRRRFEAGLEWVREAVLGRLVDLVISWRYLFIGLVLSLFLCSVGLLASGVLKTAAFPDIDGDVLMARILLPQGTPLDRTEAVVERVVTALERTDEHFTPMQPMQDGKRPRLVQNVSVQFNLNADAGESGPHVATVVADLLKAEQRNATLDAMTEVWRGEVGSMPDVISITYKQPAHGPAGLAIDIRLQGEDLHRLKLASMELQDWLHRYKGVVDLHDDLRPGKPEMVVRLRDGVMALGLDGQAIARQLRAAFHGVTAAQVQVGSESYEIDVRLASRDQNSLADLENFHVTTPTGRQAPLSGVATVHEERGWARITRIDSQRTVTIQGDVDTRHGNANAIIADTRVRFLPILEEMYPDLRITLEGQASEGHKTQRSLQTALLVGVFAIFLLLSFQFKSYIEPLVVILAIPMAGIGVIWGHLIMGYVLTMPSIMGFVSLAGVVVNDSILLVHFLKLRMAEGLSARQAAPLASRERFRAILLTSTTTILGLAPLMLERSLQAQFLIPLAISIVFGLLASTVLVLLVIPALYTILDDLGLTAVKPHSEES